MGVVVLILKILLYIILAVLGIVLLVLIIPVGGEFSFIGGKFSYKVRASVINVMDSEGGGVLGWLKKRKNKPKKPKKDKDEPATDTVPEDDISDLDDIPVNDPEELAEDLPAVTEETLTAETETDAQTVPDNAAEPPKSAKKEKKKKKHSKEPEEYVWEYEDGDEENTQADSDKEKNDEAEEKKSLTDKLEFIIGIWESAQRPMLKIFKGFHFRDLCIDFVISDYDAYDCALKYGKMCAVVYNGLALMSGLFDVRFKTVDVRPGFSLSKSQWDAAAKVSFRAGTPVIAGLWFLITYIFRTFIPDKLKKRKLRKTAAEQK